MMNFKSREEVEHIRKLYPVGTRIVLKHLNDPYRTVPSGTVGEVTHVDDIGQIHWIGCGLALNVDEDIFYRIDKYGFPIDEEGERIH